MHYPLIVVCMCVFEKDGRENLDTILFDISIGALNKKRKKKSKMSIHNYPKKQISCKISMYATMFDSDF